MPSQPDKLRDMDVTDSPPLLTLGEARRLLHPPSTFRHAETLHHPISSALVSPGDYGSLDTRRDRVDQ